MSDEILISTSSGPIKGHSRQLANGATIDEFLGIPFAEPPTGKLRLLKPRPKGPWTEVLDANEYSQICPQISMIAGDGQPAYDTTGLVQGEDCLYLNVWRAKTDKKSLPVFVYVHGGGYCMGTANEMSYFLGNLAEGTSCIAVNMNYRLHSIGFWYIEGVNDPNIALYDQQMAMRWVHENIAGFGGDPNNITLCGQSAGSCSVGWHYLNPDSNKYFNKAIMMSGGVSCPWGFNRKKETLISASKKFLEEAGGDPNASVEDQLAFMQSLDVGRFQEGQAILMIWGPIWEDEGEVELFHKLKELGVPPKPLLSTINRYEGDVSILDGTNDEAVLAIDNLDALPAMAKQDFKYADDVISFYKEMYKNEKISPHFKAMSDMVTDYMMYLGHMTFLENNSKIRPETPIYFGVNDMKGEGTKLMGLRTPVSKHARASHGLDIPRLFDLLEDKGENDEKIIDFLQRLVGNILTNGRPQLEGWPPYEREKQQYGLMGLNGVTYETSFKAAAVDFWKEINNKL